VTAAQLLVVTRTCAALAVGWLAVAKLLSLERVADQIWIPVHAGRTLRRRLVGGLVVIELGLVFLIVLNPEPRWLATGTIVAFFLVVSGHGTHAIDSGFSCGLDQRGALPKPEPVVA
jgi:hypothetical protein